MPDRAAIVTGASRGIGFALADALGEAGYGLTVSARKPDTLERAENLPSPFTTPLPPLVGTREMARSAGALVSNSVSNRPAFPMAKPNAAGS
jgi:NAD(P)-dependent dehydrogenase (short-subunit alcohol dehydrogenase family)